MDSQLIISVGREFGSAGHEIAQHLADHYQIPLYDSNLLNEVALEKNLDLQKLQGLDEKNKKYVCCASGRAPDPAGGSTSGTGHSRRAVGGAVTL